jgi:hypothetical protein
VIAVGCTIHGETECTIRKADLLRKGFTSLLISEESKLAYVTLHLTGGASGKEEKPGGDSRQASTIAT